MTFTRFSQTRSPHTTLILSFSDGNLYAGVHVDFMGTDPAIFRTLGDRPAVRTEQYDSRWLNGMICVQISKVGFEQRQK